MHIYIYNIYIHIFVIYKDIYVKKCGTKFIKRLKNAAS